MEFWSRLFGKRPAGDELADTTRDALLFMHAVKMQVDQRDLMIPSRHVLFYVYAYGAIAGLSRGLDDTQRLAVLFRILRSMSGMPEQDISAMIGECMAAADQPSGATLQRAGYDAVRAWQSGQTGVTADLGKRLRAMPEGTAQY